MRKQQQYYGGGTDAHLNAFAAFIFRQVFAICAMRSIYTLVSHAISDLPYLKPAVALVLGFVGGKMFAEFFHYDIGVGPSLAVVSKEVEHRLLEENTTEINAERF